MRSSGFEPPRYCYRQPLKLVRLPVPPRPRVSILIARDLVCQTHFGLFAHPSRADSCLHVQEAFRVAEMAGMRSSGGRGFAAGLIVFAGIFVASGFLHFFRPQPYMRIIPPALPWPRALVFISGAAEILGGAGLFLRKFRRAAAYGLALLLVAVFPANIYMAVAHVSFPGVLGESWVQWLRLPLQIPLIAWALYYARSPRGQEPPRAPSPAATS